MASDIDFETSDVEYERIQKFENWTRFKHDTGVKTITAVSLNIRSIFKYWNTFTISIYSQLNNIDIIILCETSIDEHNVNLYKIPGFNSFHYCRKKRSGGGIIVYFKENLIFEKNDIIATTFESVYGTFSVNQTKRIHLLALYRPPNTNKKTFLKELENILENIDIKETFLLLGDVNLNLLSENEPIVLQYEYLMANYGLVKCINDITREAVLNTYTTATCLDHIYIREREKSELFSCVCETRIADHYITAVSVYLCNNDSEITHHEYNTALSEKNVEEMILKTDWNSIQIHTDPHIIYQYIKSHFKTIYEKNSFTKLVKKTYRHNQKSWMNNILIENIQIRDKLWRKWKNMPTNKKFEKDYKTYRNKLNKQISDTKKSYYNNKFNNCFKDIKKTWNEINKILGRKNKSSCDAVISKYFLKTTPTDVAAENFANFFDEGVIKLLHDCDIRASSYRLDDLPHSMYLPRASVKQIESIIGLLKNSKTPGLDQIRMYDIKKHVKILSPVITHFINSIIDTCQIPEGLKTSIVRPIYKGGDHSIINNYRPISLLPALEKILEKYIAIYLDAYLNKFDIIDECQYGFQKKKSCDQLLKNFTNFINTELNSQKHILVLFIDFSKAFDTLSHKQIIKVLQSIGIRGKLLTLIINYLSNRKINVKILNVMSKSKFIRSGVPQGSILGPKLYIIYVIAMSKLFRRARRFIFADDTALIVSNENPQIAIQELQTDFDELLKWAHDVGLVINVKKTKCMYIRSPSLKIWNIPNLTAHNLECIHRKITINCQCEKIEFVNEYTYLGLKVDNTFKWDKQVTKICNQLRALANNFYKLKFVLPHSTLKLVYFSLVESILRYGIRSWGNTSMTYIKYVQNLQTSIIKKIVSPNIYRQRHNVQLLYCAEGLLSIKGIFWFLTINDNWGDNTYKRPLVHSHSTRFTEKKGLKIPKISNKYGSRTLEYCVPVIFNKLMNNFALEEKENLSMKIVKKWLINEKSMYL